MTVHYARDTDGIAHVITGQHEEDPCLYVTECGANIPEGEVETAETLEDIEHPRHVGCLSAWDKDVPDCPECGSDRVTTDSAVRIDPETKETLGSVEIFECHACETVFKEVEQ